MVKLQRYKWLIGFTFFLVALYLRTLGLSHDLQLGKVYHPDTPKQTRAVERFLDGDYYTVVGGRDYEGYPLFNSHLVEYLIRAYQFAGGLISGHLGLSGQIEQPAYLAIFWITRLLNATLSASAVWLVYLIGWRWFAPSAGIIAALLLTFSPVDINACHYANGDTAAAFFTLLGVYLALRLLERPSLPLYFLAGLVAAAAFSSKYHGGIALGTAGLAHLFHYAKARRPFSAVSIGRGFLLLISFIIGLFLTSPALIVYTDGAFDDIVQFFEYTASFGMTAEMREMSTWERFRMGMSVNMPVLQDVVGMIPAIAALLALIAGFLRAPVWIIASLPLVYILAGLATKPLTHAVYHTMATPGIMLLAGFSLFWLQSAKRIVWPRRIIVMALTVIATGYLAAYAHRELFFFRHNDTRYLAESWARDNIPPSFKLNASPYTFDGIAWHTDPESKPEGEAYVFSGRTGINPPAGAIPLHTFNIEHEKLLVFRNWPQYFFLANSPFVSSKEPRPGFQPLPSPHPLNLIDLDAPWWVRHNTTWWLSEGETRRGSLTTTNAMVEAAWYIRNAGDPAELSLTIGGQQQNIRLDPGESSIIKVEDIEPMRLSRVSQPFYGCKVLARFGAARVSLLTSERDIAWSYFNSGRFAEARKVMDEIPAQDLSPGDSIIHAISMLTSGADPGQITRGVDTLSLLDDYGISSAYLERLPGISWPTIEWQSITVTNQQTGEYLFDEYRLPEISLEPGMYTFEITTGEAYGAGIELVLLDELDRILELRNYSITTQDNGALQVHVAVEQQDAALWPRIRYNANENHLAIQSIAIKPDIQATLNSYAQLLNFMKGGDVDPEIAERFWYSPLLAFADQLAGRGETTRAHEVYHAAIKASPNRRLALERARHLSGDQDGIPEALSGLFAATAPYRVIHPAPARFDTGVELLGYQLSSTRVKAGESFGFLTHWRPDKLNRNVRRQAAWLHVIPEGQKHPAFQGDQTLMNMLRDARPGEDALLPALVEIQVPPDTPPGRYTLKTGIWIPSQRKRVKVTEADIPHERRAVTLTTIEVTP